MRAVGFGVVKLIAMIVLFAVFSITVIFLAQRQYSDQLERLKQSTPKAGSKQTR